MFTSVLELIIGIIYWLFISVMGKIATWAFQMIVWVAGFSGFTNLDVINSSWEIVRDFCNLLFIIILLVIAFGTILKIESYSYKKLLPKMIIAAILINFSKLICGVIVDASQVVMLTFVAAFQDAASKGFYQMFGLDKLVGLNLDASVAETEIADGRDLGDYLLVVVTSGAMITVLAMLGLVYVVVLISRIVFIWTLTILSPIAFVASILPITQKYAQRWWSTFGRYVVVGPILAFFIWLALFVGTKSGTNIIGDMQQMKDLSKNAQTTQLAGLSAAMEPQAFANFIIATMMLMVGLTISNEMASEVGSITSKASGFPKSIARWAGNLPIRGAKAYGAYRWKDTKSKAALAGAWIHKRTGFNPNFGEVMDQKIERRKKIANQYNAQGLAKEMGMVGRGSLWTLPLGGGQTGVEYAHEMGPIRMPRIGILKRKLKGLKLPGLQQESKDLDQQRQALDNERDQAHASHQDVIDAGKEKDKLKTEADDIGAETEALSSLEQLKGLISSGMFDIGLEDHRELLAKHNNGKDLSPDDYNKLLGGSNSLSDNKTISGNIDVTIKERATDLAKRKNSNDVRMQRQNDRIAAAMEAVKKDIGYDAKAKSIADRKKDVTERIQEAAPAFDPARDMIQAKIVQEASNNLVTTSDVELKKKLRNALTHGRKEEALGIYYHMAKVGHPNEPMKEFGYADNAEGMRKFIEEKFLSGPGALDEQLVMSTVNLASQAAEKNRQYAYAWMVDQDDMGNFSFRDETDRQKFVAAESNKVGLLKLLREGGHMTFGQGTGKINPETGEPGWELMSGILSMMSQNSRDPHIIKAFQRGNIVVNGGITLPIKKNAGQADLITRITGPQLGRVFKEILGEVAVKSSRSSLSPAEIERIRKAHVLTDSG